MLTVWGGVGGGGGVLFCFGFLLFVCLFVWFFLSLSLLLFWFCAMKWNHKKSLFIKFIDEWNLWVQMSWCQLSSWMDAKFWIFLSDLSKYPFSLSWSYSAVLSLRLSTTLVELSLWLKTCFVQYFSKILFKRVVWIEVL